jgi:hypothetical protein
VVCAGVKYPKVRLVSVNSKIENIKETREGSEGVPEVLSCGGHFRQRNTKTVVIKHHAKKGGNRCSPCGWIDVIMSKDRSSNTGYTGDT